jgi:hypothetical protein
MRRLAPIFLSLILPATLPGQTTVTVRQLENFLLSREVQRESDAVLARQLASFQLSDQLTDARLAALAPRLHIGPSAAEQLELIASASIFAAPPPPDLVSQPPPDAHEQSRILQSARDYANSFAQRLPDFLALRSTRSFDNAPMRMGKKRKPVILIHYVGARRREVAVRSGMEVTVSQPGSQSSDSDHAEGMTTWGEFGPLLTAVLADTLSGAIAWSRWENGTGGATLAVFRYSVPQPASHDVIDLDAYRTLLNDPRAAQPIRYSERPAYHGDLYIDPATGAVVRITLDAELAVNAPVVESRLAVEYAPVEIGGKTYTCPVRGIAVSVAHNQEMEAIEGGGPERFVNLVSFTDYHKFVSTSRILTGN